MKRMMLAGALSIFLMAAVSLAADAGQAQQSADDGYNLWPVSPPLKNPGTLLYELKPGESVEDAVFIKNFYDSPLVFSVYPADTEHTNNMTLAFKGQDAPRLLASGWIKLETETYSLEAGEKRLVKFMIDVPADAKLSDKYVAGIAMEKDRPESEEGSFTFKTRIVLPVYITVTDNPQPIAKHKYGQANIFASATPYFWMSIGLFTFGMAYLFWPGKKKERLSQ